MELREYLTILRERWLLVAGFVLAAVAAAVAVTMMTPRVYEAQATSIVTISGSADQDSGALYQGSQYTLQRVSSYARSVTSPDVLAPVIDTLGLDMTIDELSRKVSAETPPDTVLLLVKASDPDPERSAEISNAVTLQLAEFVETLETPAGAEGSAVKVSVTEPAAAPSSAASPRPPFNIALGLLVGLALGLVAPVLRSQLDTSVKSADALSALTAKMSLGVVPVFRRSERKSPLIARDDRTRRAEAYRTLRTRLSFVDVHDPPKSLVVTSPGYGEGKTLTAANLSLALSHGGKRVCLVEADLRRPMLAEFFGVEGSLGLTDVLSGERTLDEVLLLTEGITVLGAGPLPADPGALVGAAAMAEAHHELRGRFDIVIFDAPPLVWVPDAAVLAAVADGAVMVVRSGRTRANHVQQACEALDAADAELLGTVLTFAGGRRSRRMKKARAVSRGRTAPTQAEVGREMAPVASEATADPDALANSSNADDSLSIFRAPASLELESNEPDDLPPPEVEHEPIGIATVKDRNDEPVALDGPDEPEGDEHESPDPAAPFDWPRTDNQLESGLSDRELDAVGDSDESSDRDIRAARH